MSRESSPYSGALPKTATLETSDTIYKTQSAHKSNPVRYWNPIWLTKTVLCVFVVVFGLLVATLITLYIISVKRTGLVSQRDAYRYTWTYGPTAGETTSCSRSRLLTRSLSAGTRRQLVDACRVLVQSPDTFPSYAQSHHTSRREHTSGLLVTFEYCHRLRSLQKWRFCCVSGHDCLCVAAIDGKSVLVLTGVAIKGPADHHLDLSAVPGIAGGH